MQLKRSQAKGGFIKTLLIILGVIIAFLMSLNSPLFTAAHSITPVNRSEEATPAPAAEKHESTSSSSAYNSGARLFHIFTENLPYLNNK